MNQKGFANILLIILVVIIAASLGYVFYNIRPSTTDTARVAQNSSLDTPADSNQTPGNPSVSEKQKLAGLFSSLGSWSVQDPATKVDIRDCGEGLRHDPRRAVYEMSFTPSRDSDGAYKTTEVKTKVSQIQTILTANGWRKCSGGDEPGFYQQQTYVKNDTLLGLNWGTRDAVIGGSYITIQFEYDK